MEPTRHPRIEDDEVGDAAGEPLEAGGRTDALGPPGRVHTLLAALALAFTTPALAENAPKKHRYECVFPDKATEVVEAPDDEAARSICRDSLNKTKRAGRHTNGTRTGGGVDDDLFSRRSL